MRHSTGPSSCIESHIPLQYRDGFHRRKSRHGQLGSDDYANALAGLFRCLTSSIDVTLSWVEGPEDAEQNGKQSHAAAMLVGYLARHGIAV